MGYKSLFLLNYNQYYNRLVKKEETIDAYAPYIVYGPDEANTYKLVVSNFNPNDGINTEHVFNVPEPNFDYVVVVDESNEIDSRWFVVQAERTRGNQYRVSLRRDLMADYYDEVLGATAYVERAILNYGNKLIFNAENSLVNQIKKSEALLQDETKSGWIVGYIANNHDEKTINVSAAEEGYPESPLSLSTIRSYNNPYYFQDNTNNPQLTYNLTWLSDTDKTYWIELAANGDITWKSIEEYWGIGQFDRYAGGALYPTGKTLDSCAAALSEKAKTRDAQYIKDSAFNYAQTLIDGTKLSNVDLATLKGMSGGTYVSDGTAFTITVTESHLSTPEWKVASNAGALYDLMDGIFREANVGGSQTAPNNSYSFRVFGQKLNISITEISKPATATIRTTVATLSDAPYKMFAIPFERITIEDANDTSFVNNKNVAMRLANAIATDFGTALYDIQLLPYCPFRAIINGSEKINIAALTNDVSKTEVFIDGAPASIILWPKTSNFAFSIEYNIPVPATPIEFKVENEVSFVRLCSPNYSGAFEFKPTSNYGINSFEVNCTYKPYSPYIHVSPIWNETGLYGGNYIDQRGLVCTGDFSLPIVTNEWKQYQINNKSYLDSFNRQIENMTAVFNIQREQQKTAGFLNTISATVSSAASGGYLGGTAAGPKGALAGAVIGGTIGAATSAWGAEKDLEYADRLQKEAKSYTQDQFNLSLQNIQALPYTLGKVSAFTINNKIFPFLEFYSCSDEEKAAITARIRYMSMTVGEISNISKYIQSEPTFIQAQLIRIESIAEDYHTVAELASELHKGIYI